jgi:radical SAM superfamily enzyme YgiQ (UPF0313 family)
MRRAENVLEELRLVAAQGYREVFIRDEIFTADRRRLLQIARGMIEEELDLTWICSARVGTIDEEMMQLMKESGCHMIRVGVESGVQSILDRAKKGITVRQTEELLDLAHRYNIEIHAHMMLGMPGETRETIEETLRFVKKIKPAVVTFGICTPYPGTALFEEVSRAHPDILDGSACNLAKLHQQGFFNSAFCSLSEEDLGICLRKAYRSFYLQPRFLLSRLRSLRSREGWKRNIKAGLKVLSFSLERPGKS